MKNLTPELKEYKTEFDFLHRKIGELEWEKTICLAKGEDALFEIDRIEEQVENYYRNATIVLEKVREEVRRVYKQG